MSPIGSKRSLFRRVFGTIFVVAVVVVVVLTAAGTAYLQRNLADVTRAELHDEAAFMASALNRTDDDVATIESLSLQGKRVTLIAPDGTVVYDSEEPAAQMENHAGRPEVAAALAQGQGASERASSTLGEVMLYQAVRLDDGMVVRLAQEQDGFLSVLVSLAVPLVLLAAVLLAISFATARRSARAIIAPLLDVDLDHPRRNSDTVYAEMMPMLDRIESQRQELKQQMRALADNDRMRREFTANITHELKTPLTTISGYAELIAGGMVADEADLRDFGGRIHREAGRLTALVNDILTLSNLDEAERSDIDGIDGAASVLGSVEPVDLPRMLESIQQRLEQMAARSEVTLLVEAEPAMVVGVPRLLDELAYNLASNGIRYNLPQGTVTLKCGVDAESHPYIQVVDTGIGIAPEEQGKVFERFYRVDKSRSKARGGTGLGLAIVKHAAVFHGATIDMASELGMGTCITVTFPVQDLPEM
ncbi:ATP-binding protein [Enorma burkinafasonensis]|uniref:sensor histidine kinase n=1 Tax=Enorma burkinafasonensis TaxID=2590867 RepID=UPI0026F21D4B|nr:ATP-binding protein [Enorma burkinafasonensis]MCI7731410.1 ATP-binding protein [Enorma burkinafasonensis]